LPDNYSRLIAEISARMVKVSPEDLDAEISRSIKEALQPLRVDRGGLLEVVEGAPIVRVSHAWFDDGIEHVPSDINLAEYFPWTYQKVVVEGRSVAISKFDDIPVDAEVDRRSQKLLAIKSRVTIPLFIGQRVHHLVSVDAIREERDWPDDVIAHLRLLCESFVNALQRREADQALSLAIDRLNLAASSAEAGLWELDLESGQFWATEIARNMFGFTADINITLDNFLGKVHPEDRDLIVNAISALSTDHRELVLEYRAPGPGRQMRWMYSRGCLTETGSLHHKALRGVTLDITQRKRMEIQLQEQLLEIERLHDQLEKENVYLRNEVIGSHKPHFISSAANSMQKVMAQIEQVARTGSTVLVEGETGTGKEVVAQAIHRHSDRGKRIMIKVNCAALPAPLMESELFGREKGAYTGALSQQAGRFEIADKTTLFLDEIAELPHEAQAKLLRFLQEGEFERLGSSRTIKVDVRIIAATNRNLLKEIEQGRFRRDLYYRLAVFPIKVPPLRERSGDIEQLVWEFIAEFSERMGKRIRQIASRDMEALKAYPWPGNVRELRNIIERAMIVTNGETLEIQALIPAASHAVGGGITTLEDAERQHIQKALKIARGKIKGAGGAAELLDINPSTLTSRMLKLGIRPAQS
jgi:transcriptional regulator with GAF, ATPase, and Fis domain